MKKIQSKLLFLIFATISCIQVNAQSRIKKKYFTDDGIQINHVQKNAAQTLLPSSLSSYYFEGFENTFPPAGWQIVDVIDSLNGWTSSTVADYPDAYEGTQAAYCRYAYPGPIGEDWLISPKFSVVAGDSLSFQFKWESLGYQYDSTFVLVSTTDSALSSFTNTVGLYVDTTTTQILGVVGGWYYKTYSLNAFAGQDIYVAFINKNSNGDAIYIDNVELGTRPVAEAAAISVDMDQYYASGNSTPVATVKNKGGITQTFDVTMNITGGYNSTKSVTLGSQAEASVLFDTWNATVGNYTISVQTLLTGDVNPANDTISKTIKVLEPFVNYGWSTHDPLVAPTIGGGAVSICTNTNSRYFLMGGLATGNFLSDAYEYDLSFGTWGGISSLPNSSGYAATATANGKIVVVAAATGAGNPDGLTKIYNYNTDTWTTGSPMPIPAGNCAFGTYKDSLIYIIGGNIGNVTGTNNVQIYNTYTDTWSVGTAKPGIPVYAIRGGIAGNKIVVTGGYDPLGEVAMGTTYVGIIDTLNPTQIAWTQVADHPAGIISRAGPGVSLDKNSSLVIFAGGSNTNTTATTTPKTFAYDVNSNSWKLGPDKPTALNLFYMTSVLQNDSLYLAALGGNDGIGESDKNEWLNLGSYQIPTTIVENNFVTDANLFPNPANEVTTLSLNLKNAAHLEIYITDVLGNVVLNVFDKNCDAGKNSISIQTKSLTSGIYFCVMNFGDTTITKKLLKN